jgi:predicted RNase H-like HicB family nuclease
MISEFVEKKLREAKYKIIKSGSYFGEIPSVKGVWASSKNLEDCRAELKEVLEDWILLKIHDEGRIPGFSIKIGKKELVGHA